MPFPNFKNKHSHDAMFSPKDFLAYKKKVGKGIKFKPPKAVIFCYHRSVLEYVIKKHKVTKVDQKYIGEMYLLGETKNQVAILGKFGIGAAIAVVHLEELIALGVKRFVSIGTAGTLQKNIPVGSLVVCEKAIRDEGTSHHYVKPSKYSYASKEMTKKIQKSLNYLKQKYVVGTSWTIDAPYRETVAEARQYQKEGVATVEMEASALFAVAQFRKVQLGAIFTISDSLAELEWAPKFFTKKASVGLEIIYKVALDALS